MKADSPAIPNSDSLFKHTPEIPLVGWAVLDEGLGTYQVKSGAFQWHEDGISSYRRIVIESLGLTFHCVKRAPRNGVFELQVNEIRKLEFGVADDPNPSYIDSCDLLPRDEAHALIVKDDELKGGELKKRTRAMARTAVIVHTGD